METRTITTGEEDAGQRLDKVLAARLPGLSRARVQALIAQGRVTAQGAVQQDASRKVKAGEAVTVTIPPPADAAPRAQDIALDIVYEDGDLLVLNKPPGLVVHPAAGNHDGTLVNALLAHCGDGLSGIGGVKRPGIVHRLDKDTSGLMAVAKNDAAHHGLAAQLASRTLARVYHAIVWGCPSPREGVIETHIGRSRANRKKMAVLDAGGKAAVTAFRVLRPLGALAALVECRLQTGRTHQIRVHMAHLRHWIAGDPVYGHPSARRVLKLQKAPPEKAGALLSFPRQALHAARLEFIHPISENRMSFTADLPGDMQALLETLGE